MDVVVWVYSSCGVVWYRTLIIKMVFKASGAIDRYIYNILDTQQLL